MSELLTEFLHEEDVISVEAEDDILAGRFDMSTTFRVKELKDSIEANDLDEILGKTFECRVFC